MRSRVLLRLNRSASKGDAYPMTAGGDWYEGVLVSCQIISHGLFFSNGSGADAPMPMLRICLKFAGFMRMFAILQP